MNIKKIIEQPPPFVLSLSKDSMSLFDKLRANGERCCPIIYLNFISQLFRGVPFRVLELLARRLISWDFF
jgi:hypothetical protein